MLNKVPFQRQSFWMLVKLQLVEKEVDVDCNEIVIVNTSRSWLWEPGIVSSRTRAKVEGQAVSGHLI